LEMVPSLLPPLQALENRPPCRRSPYPCFMRPPSGWQPIMTVPLPPPPPARTVLPFYYFICLCLSGKVRREVNHSRYMSLFRCLSCLTYCVYHSLILLITHPTRPPSPQYVAHPQPVQCPLVLLLLFTSSFIQRAREFGLEAINTSASVYARSEATGGLVAIAGQTHLLTPAILVFMSPHPNFCLLSHALSRLVITCACSPPCARACSPLSAPPPSSDASCDLHELAYIHLFYVHNMLLILIMTLMAIL
uniref:Product n=1 Tax=Schistocephalus solidus TaxID=70667 RepID=A0A183S9W2_SCHSO